VTWHRPEATFRLATSLSQHKRSRAQKRPTKVLKILQRSCLIQDLRLSSVGQGTAACVDVFECRLRVVPNQLVTSSDPAIHDQLRKCRHATPLDVMSWSTLRVLCNTSFWSCTPSIVVRGRRRMEVAHAEGGSSLAQPSCSRDDYTGRGMRRCN